MTVDLNSIRNFCEDSMLFKAGKELFDENRVYNVIYMPEISTLKCNIQEAEGLYNVEAVFGEEDIESCSCDCGRKVGANGVCRHVVAALLQYKKEQSDALDEKGGQFYEQVSHDVIEKLSGIKLSRNKHTIHFVPVFEINKNGFGYYDVRFCIGIGTDKLYKVRRIDKLIDTISENGELEFSKNFVFNARTQTFGDNEMALVDYLMTLKQLYFETGRSMGERSISLSGAILVKVAELAAECEGLSIVMDKRNLLGCHILKNKFEVPLELSKSGNKYVIDFERWKDIKVIDEQYRIVMFENAFHILSSEQAEVTKTLLIAGESLGSTRVAFNMEDKNAVVENLMPKLRYLSDLSIDDNIRKDILVAELKVKVYLESTEEKNIKAKVLFCYEDIEFNHFAGERPKCDDKVLLRDKRRENDFIRVAAKMGFVPVEGNLYINSPRKIYEFLNSGIKKLKKISDIFYAENFYNIKVVMPAKAVGAISIGAGNLFEFQVGFDDIPPDELESILESVREKEHYYRLTNGNFVNLQSSALEQISELMDNVDGKFEENGKAKLTLPQVMYLETQNNNEEFVISRDKPFAEIIEELKEPVNTNFVVPECLKDIMREYQITGFKWLKTMASYGFGGILADEMGLGKTLQTIAFIISEYEKNKKPALVIVPTSLLFNWQAEFKKFTPQYKVKVVYGQPDERKIQIEDIDGCVAVITSYGLIRRDVAAYKKREWSYCFIDEAQHIKNPNTVNAKTVKQIKADGFFAITGTPIENNLTELWSIFDFVMPGYLFSRAKYRRVYEIPIIKKNDSSGVEKLLKHTKPFILRRLKSGVMKELPEKIETYMVTDLEEEQRQLYQAYAYRAREEILRLTREKGFEKSRIEILAQITRLRQLCCHPGLFIDNYEGGSGKLNTLLELVEDGISSGRRMLIFSQFTSMLEIIAEMLRQMDINYFYLDGSVKSSKRIEISNAFNEGQRDIFLISLKAGGTGLNLIGADTVIHYDPWWNPAVENQATDRAHRIGQTKVVQVIKLVTKGTIEEKIQDLKEKKQELINAVLQEGTGSISSMTLDEIQKLFE
ncbi:MAG: DEAD/DEAH box helicase [Bacillota bacterium]|nr:DEAD/DEAH box helicase [Bacillota bacterium]